VASIFTDDVPLLISAKALASSRHHNISNRMREMIGEAASMRQRDPHAVLGYLCLIAGDEPGRIGGRLSHHSDATIAADIGARCLRENGLPLHHFDAGCVLRADLSRGSCRALRGPGLFTFAEFLDELVRLWQER
jgi:hypothetical protein